MKSRPLLLVLPLLSATSVHVLADEPDSAPGEVAPREVVITATRIESDPFNVPAAITSISAEQLRGDALGVNLADDVASVPGLLARNRYNYAQDQQISIRGIGANSAFGIRGVRIYQDGLPATGPDGQGQVSQYNLDSASRVEVLRGPFSALYGNSSGGVIQLFTATGQGPLQLRTSVAYGSFDNMRASLDASGSIGGLGYNLDYTHFQVDGFREHSAAKNDSFNGKLNYSLNEAMRLTLVTNVVSRPDAQDPLGLTTAEFARDPESTDPAALQFNTRKSLQQQQGGLIYDWDLNEHQSIRVTGYLGHRIVQQFLSIPMASQSAFGSAGGVVDLNRNYGGTDARWSWKGDLADRPMTWVAGFSYDRQNELRRGYNNYVSDGLGGTVLGVQGDLRRNENNIAKDLDEYVQGTWDFLSQWSAMVGVRHSDVKFDSEDHYIVGANLDDSGSVSYKATSPVAGLVYKPLEWLRAYASYGQGFQTPLGSELAYRPDGLPGLNLELKPARSNNTEAGLKVDINSDVSAEMAAFQSLTRDEIVVATNIGGRTTYQNAGRTRRRGFEYSMNYRIAPDWRFQAAYTFVDATYTDPYLTCTAAPCPRVTNPAAPPTGNRVLIGSGNRLPGVPRNNAFVALRWGGEVGFHAAVNSQYVTNVAVNDQNTTFAPQYTVMGLDGGYVTDLSQFRLSAFLRLNNLLNRRYVGSVIVDDGNGRFFEPAPGFNVLGGFSVTMK